MTPILKIKAGDTFGRLTVIDPNVAKTKALCRCVCGNERTVRRNHLTSGATQSCGCLRDERIREAVCTHGQSKSKMHVVWAGMLQRCRNPRDTSFARYGGRGVKVCPQWDPQQGGSFEQFAADMGEPPTPLHTIDKDKLGDGLLYSPETCCWLTPKEQARNTRRNLYYEICGFTKCLAEWAEFFGINYGTVYDRLSRGWSIGMALSTPVRS